LKASAPGKLVLLGEYAVLEGAPALVVAVSRLATATITSSRQPRLWTQNLGIAALPYEHQNNRVTFADGEHPELKLFCEVLSELKATSFDIYLDTSAFSIDGQKLGLGSSAAICVALLAALTGAQGRELFTRAAPVHARFQKQPGSGIDIAASVYGGLLQYQVNELDYLQANINALRWPKELFCLAVQTRFSASTSAMIGNIKDYSLRDPQGYDQYIQKLTAVSAYGCTELASGNAAGFCEAVVHYYEGLLELGAASKATIVTDEHAAIAQLVSALGGVYKPSGAGGGDVGVAFCCDAKTNELLRQQLHKAGYPTLDLDFELSGARLLEA
jgi:phosphomevalonate kinase